MALERGKIYIPPGPEEVRRDFLDDIELAALADGVEAPIEPKTDWYVLGTALGNLAMMEYANVSIGDQNARVTDAVGEELDQHREDLGMPVAEPAPGSGRIIVSIPSGGPVTINAGKQLLWPNGKLGQVAVTTLGVLDGQEVPVASLSTGEDTNVDAGETITFVDPPLGVERDAEVSAAEPITGGIDEEGDERKRDRILNRLRTTPGSGNWGHNIEEALNALTSIQYAFVYPGLGGPSSRKIVLVRDINPGKNLFSRSPTAAQVELVRARLHAELPDGSENVVQAAADEFTDVSIGFTVPEAVAAGGTGQGWLDATQWPLLDGDTECPISVVTSPTQLTVNAATTAGPIAGQSHVAWWSSVSQMFQVRLVTAVAGGTGAWQITVDTPLTDHLGNPPAVGDYISPAAVNTEAYGKQWREVMRRLGPGENTVAPIVLPRAKRHPLIEREWFPNLGVKQLTALTDAFKEVSDGAFIDRSLTTPTVPASVATPPNILRPRHFGIYRQ